MATGISDPAIASSEKSLQVVRDYGFNSTHTCPATSQNFVRIFYNDSEAIISRISAHCPGGQTFLSEKHLKEFANHIHLAKMI